MWYINCSRLVVPRLYGDIITMLSFYDLFLFFAIKTERKYGRIRVFSDQYIPL